MKIALLFPGQGSQQLGMMDDFINLYPKAKELFEQTSDIIGINCFKVINDLELLNQTHITQPIILASSHIIISYLRENVDILPIAVAGHSLGEYSALLAADGIKFADAVKLVNTRGKLMQKSVAGKNTAMAAVLGLDDDIVIDKCEELSKKGRNVSAVNFNCKGQVVIAGLKQDVEYATSILKEVGAKRVVLLEVSVPSHCNLMNPVIEEFKSVLEGIEIKVPKFDFYQNITAKPCKDILQIKTNLVNQIAYPVLWHQTINAIEKEQPAYFIECGFNKVLTGLNKKITKIESKVTSTIEKTAQLIEIL